MVKNSHNNKVNNYINIVNDLKGLGLLQRKRRRTRSEAVQSSKVQAKSQFSGIEKTIIDNSPQLRRDVQQLANERSILEDRVMENENKLKFLHRTINENPFRFIDSRGRDEESFPSRFMTQSSTFEPRSLSNVESSSLRLPTMSQLYNDDAELRNDGINVPIVDASESFKSSLESKPEPRMPIIEPDDVPIVDNPGSLKLKKVKPVQESPDDIQPIRPVEIVSKTINDNYSFGVSPDDIQSIRPVEEGSKNIKVRATSPKPSPINTPVKTLASIMASPDTIERRKQFVARATNLGESKAIDIVRKHWGDNFDLIELEKREKLLQDKAISTPETPQNTKEKEPKELTSAQRKAILAKERKQQDAELAELKANENASLTQVSKERALADAKTENLIKTYFQNYGGKEYVLKNVKKDLDRIEKLATDNQSFVLNKSNQELLEKYYGYLKLSGSIQKFAGRGYGSTALLFQIPSIKENLSKKLHMPDLWNARKPRENRSSSVPMQRSTGIHTLNDIVSASSGGNTKA